MSSMLLHHLLEGGPSMQHINCLGCCCVGQMVIPLQ